MSDWGQQHHSTTPFVGFEHLIMDQLLDIRETVGQVKEAIPEMKRDITELKDDVAELKEEISRSPRRRRKGFNVDWATLKENCVWIAAGFMLIYNIVTGVPSGSAPSPPRQISSP